MPVSIIEVDVKDAKFVEFIATFNKYQKALKDSPDLWKGVDGAIGGAAETGLTLAAAIFAQAEAAKAVAASQKAVADAQRKAAADAKAHEISWDRISSSAKSFAGNIKDAVGTLIKWTSVGSVAGGLLGAGGLFGLDELAGGVSATRRQSLGLGTSYGGLKSFGVNFSRLVDPSSFLSGVSDALGSPGGRVGLYRAGLRESDINGKTTDQVGASALAGIKALTDRTLDRNLYTLVPQLGGLVSLEDLRRIKNTPKSEMKSLAASFLGDSAGLGLSPDVQAKWQNFTTQLGRAGQQIQATLVKGLVPLATPLAHLSQSIVKAIETFFGVGDPVRIKKISDGIDHFATYIGSDKFQSDVSKFSVNIGKLSDELGVIVTKFAWLLPAQPKPPSRTTKATIAGAAIGAAIGASVGAVGGGIGIVPGAIVGGFLGGAIGHGVGQLADAAIAEGTNNAFRRLGWSPEAAAALQGNSAWESGNDPNQYGDNGAAYGLFQWHKDRQQDFAKWAGHSIIGSSAAEQIGFANYELTQGKERAAGNLLKQAKTVADAVKIIDYLYERPANPAASLSGRTALATKPRVNANVTLKVMTPPGSQFAYQTGGAAAAAQ